MVRHSNRSRRSVLKGAGVAVGAMVLAGCGGPGGEEDDIEDDAGGVEEDAEEGAEGGEEDAEDVEDDAEDDL